MSRSLVIAKVGISHLGLRSLKEISDGDVEISKNPNLCYTLMGHWKRLFKSNKQTAKVEENLATANCGTLNSSPFIML